MTYGAGELARIRKPILLSSAAMWLLLLLAPSGIAPGAHCSASGTGQAPVAGSFEMFLARNPPASLALGWIVMLVAMMLPVLITPVQHIRRRSFKRRRARSMVLFFAGYAVVWMALGAVVLPLELRTRTLAGESFLPVAGIALTAVLWQFSPLKQRCLNRCHAFAELAAFGARADWDAMAFGITQGIWCAGSCWAMMAIPMLLPRGHVPAMAVIAVLIYCERLEHPGPVCWGWRGFGRTWRMLKAQVRIRLAVRPLAASSLNQESGL